MHDFLSFFLLQHRPQSFGDGGVARSLQGTDGLVHAFFVGGDRSENDVQSLVKGLQVDVESIGHEGRQEIVGLGGIDGGIGGRLEPELSLFLEHFSLKSSETVVFFDVHGVLGGRGSCIAMNCNPFRI